MGSGSHGQFEPSTNYSIVKDGWGDRQTFQGSYGLDMTPEGIEEGNGILDAMRQADIDAHHAHNNGK
jgi:hypothetical protein